MKKFYWVVCVILFSFKNMICSAAELPPMIQTCAACHGAAGISANAEWPHLAGQHASYLYKQLKDYQLAKARQSPMMTGLVSSLSESTMHELAEYYATLPRAHGETPARYRSRGELIYRRGDVEKGITACIACHGPHGDGNEEALFPVVSGQHALYTMSQLEAFKQHSRNNDLNGIMEDITKHMSHEDMLAIAYYLEGLK